MRKAKWKLTLPLSEARRNDELVSLSSSQILRWIDELNGITDADERALAIKREIRRIRKEPNSLQNKKIIRRLYDELDAVQFKSDYLCLIIDRKHDYIRACNGFTVNGIKYHRLLGTNGGVKNSTIVFVSDRHCEELRRRIENGRDPNKELVPAKLEAYKALVCSGSTPVSMPRGVIVVSDCETEFLSDVIYLNDEASGEPVMQMRGGERISLDESDGYGLMLPSLAERWAGELHLGYTPSAVNTRFSFEKGVAFCFDFVEFAEKIAGDYIIRDAWGVERDIRNVELILTTSMAKLWDSYESLEDYLRNSEENHYTFGVTKVAPKELESERTLNYQFIQSYDLTDKDVDRLIEPTMREVRDILQADRLRSILFLKGAGLREDTIEDMPADFIKAIMVEPEMFYDPYIQSRIYRLIKNRINEAKVGVLKVHGNYSIVSGDPYALCQHMFGLEVTGLLKAGEVYNKYWVDAGADTLACYRAPMTCHNNVRLVRLNKSEEAAHWYQYMTTTTAFNAWDTAAHAMNGMDKDGDIVMLTDNEVLVGKTKELPALMCVQRKAKKIIPTEPDFVQANIASFGNDIGRITNFITSMYDVQTKYPVGSREYETLDYRIKCGQLFQQNAIDKAKGIVAKPMPKEWYDRDSALMIEDDDKRLLYVSILADRKPYFMRYIYPDLMKQYNTYIKNTGKKAQREFRKTVEDLLSQDEGTLTEDERSFLRHYRSCVPVGMGDCVTNRVCRKFEAAFDRYIGRHEVDKDFDYEIMKSKDQYTRRQYDAIAALFEEYNARLVEYAACTKSKRVDDDEMASTLYRMKQALRSSCDMECPNAKVLCNIILDLCYKKSTTRYFAWSMCADEIVDNLLERNGGEISYPVEDPNGNVVYDGKRFAFHTKKIGGAQ